MSVIPNAPIAAAVASIVLRAANAEEDLPCLPMSEIYEDGTDLCETMWGDAFEVVDDAEGYTMWFFDEKNPNNAISANRTLEGADKTCYIDDYYHKDAPGPEKLDGECGAYRNNACCKAETIPDKKTLNDIYGSDYHWDRCGPMTQQCERFFVQEACFYECDANAGYWRLYREDGMPKVDDKRIDYKPKCNPADETAYKDIGPDGTSPTGEKYVKDNEKECGEDGHNRWQLLKAPIKRSYCNAFYDACKNALFCGKGNFFECARTDDSEDAPVAPVVVTEVVTEVVKEEDEGGLSGGSIAGIAIASALAVICIIIIAVLVVKERTGSPVFTPIPHDSDDIEITKQ